MYHFTPEVFNYRLTAICSPRSSLPILRRCQRQARADRSNLASARPSGCGARLRSDQEKNKRGRLERRPGSSESQRGSSVTEMNWLQISEIHAGDARSTAHEGILSPSCLSAQLNILHISSPAGEKKHPGKQPCCGSGFTFTWLVGGVTSRLGLHRMEAPRSTIKGTRLMLEGHSNSCSFQADHKSSLASSNLRSSKNGLHLRTKSSPCGGACLYVVSHFRVEIKKEKKDLMLHTTSRFDKKGRKSEAPG